MLEQKTVGTYWHWKMKDFPLKQQGTDSSDGKESPALFRLNKQKTK